MTEGALQMAVREVGWEFVDVTGRLRQHAGGGGGRISSAHLGNLGDTVPDKDVAGYSYAGANHDPDAGSGCRVGDEERRQVVAGSSAPASMGR